MVHHTLQGIIKVLVTEGAASCDLKGTDLNKMKTVVQQFEVALVKLCNLIKQK